MGFSYIALNTLLEQRVERDPNYRRQLQKNGKILLSQARQLSDTELLEKLNRFGLQLEPSSYREQCRQVLSAEELARRHPLPDRSGRADMEADWLWYGLLILWERWFPDLPNFERLDGLMQQGYTLSHADDSPAACDRWLRAWEWLRALCDQGSFTSLEAFDDAFRGTQAAFNWVQDFETELFTAGHRDRRYYEHRIRYCEDFLKRFTATDKLMRENMRRAVAESWASLGQHERSDALFEQWLKDDPQWGWGWIGWSDTYSFTQETERDLGRAEALLKRGLDVPGVRDRE